MEIVGVPCADYEQRMKASIRLIADAIFQRSCREVEAEMRAEEAQAAAQLAGEQAKKP